MTERLKSLVFESVFVDLLCVCLVAWATQVTLQPLSKAQTQPLVCSQRQLVCLSVHEQTCPGTEGGLSRVHQEDRRPSAAEAAGGPPQTRCYPFLAGDRKNTTEPEVTA